ncbi:GLMS [Enterospora canceri]|uniref:glutamine--fructose-6-phosphate transaminase (isomerizing) n=1 Tax=Enterospora canceri TaxID=1081671 RepID=A0A1Y1S835_9MICR|nr:GLMS [Enterospora canceri]
MCGIFGIITSNSPGEVIHQGLGVMQSLGYRGYESSGILVFNETRSFLHRELALIKEESVPTDGMEEWLEEERGKTTLLLHTRWMTHGKKEIVNSHPHRSGTVYVVHNGNVDNFEALKEELSPGHSFASATDTEVILALANLLLKEGVEWGCLGSRLIGRLQGEYAFVLADTDRTNGMVVVRNGLGVAMAFSDDIVVEENRIRASTIQVCSDASNIFDKEYPAVNRLFQLEDGEIVTVENGVATVTRVGDEAVGDVLERIGLETNLPDRKAVYGKYSHMMEKEINDQAELVKMATEGRIDERGEVVLENSNLGEKNRATKRGGVRYLNEDELRAVMEKCTRMRLVACGTSYHACLAVERTLNSLLKKDISVAVATDQTDSGAVINKDDVVVLVSQSGETLDVIEIMNKAREAGATVVAFTNSPGSMIATGSNYNIDLRAGREEAVASTKAYTVQVLTMTLFGIQFGGSQGERGPFWMSCLFCLKK